MLYRTRIDTDMESALFTETGTICGINIKSISSKTEKLKFDKHGKIETNIITWGLFIHVRMNNGDQYDLIWKLERAGMFKDGKLYFPINKRKKKHPFSKEYAVIPTLFYACNAKEWVEMIGKEITVERYGLITDLSATTNKLYYPCDKFTNNDDNESDSQTGFILSAGNAKIMTDYYEIHPGKFNNK